MTTESVRTVTAADAMQYNKRRLEAGRLGILWTHPDDDPVATVRAYAQESYCDAIVELDAVADSDTEEAVRLRHAYARQMRLAECLLAADERLTAADEQFTELLDQIRRAIKGP